MKEKLPEVMCGTYRVKYDLKIRKKPGLTCDKILGYIKSGEIVEVTCVKYLKYSIWGCLECGWICLYMNHTYYAEDAICCKKIGKTVY